MTKPGLKQRRPFRRSLTFLLIFSLLFCSIPSFAVEPARIDALLTEAIGTNLIAGGVVLVGSRDQILLQRAYGRMSSLTDAPEMTVDTVFDIASLTKVIATTPAVLKLAEEGRLSLLDPIVKWFPELAGRGKDEILVLNLLTHTSGLDDVPLYGSDPMQCAVEGAAAQKLKGEVGSRFSYADLNFILLAELTRRVTGAGLDIYAQASFYTPLGMRDTTFRPQHRERCSPTLFENMILFGEVQDPLCRKLGGVSGHAGVFSTAQDLSLFCRMILSGGSLHGTRVLAERTVAQMTAPYFSRGGKVVRGLGWDISSPFSSPRGDGFSRISFGHTGYSGSSIWIDPVSDLYVILLTARLDYKKTHDFSKLRRELSTEASRLFIAESRKQEIAKLDE